MMIVWFLLAGAFAGLCAGLFGICGGMIIVPALATIIVTSISSLTAHHKRCSVR